MLDKIRNLYTGAHTLLSIETRNTGTAKRKNTFIEIECATCVEKSWMRRDVLLKSMTQCNHCSRKLKNVSHGLRELRIYSIWAGMKNRTTNPKHVKYARYGGRGIKLIFKDLIEFYEWSKLNGYKEVQSGEYKDYQAIDRIDNDGDYSPENCQWITVSENSSKKLGAYNV